MKLPSSFKNSKPIFVNDFHHREVRDLAWALLSPSLFNDIPEFNPIWFNDELIKRQTILAWLASLDKNPSQLIEHLSQQRSTRLGIYFEQLLSFYFEFFPNLSLLAKNLQVNSKERTLGEFDFIVEDHEENIITHVEVAVKFYLGYESYSGKIKKNTPLFNWHNWVGPNHKDTLAIKMRHLNQHQLSLGDTTAGQAALTQVLPKRNKISSRLFIKGRFYLPFSANIEMPKYSNPELDRHYWLTSDNLKNNPPLNKQGSYLFLPRSHWLSSITSDDIKEKQLSVYSLKEIIEKIEYDKEDLGSLNEWQLAEINTASDEPKELTRFFVINSQNLPFDE